MKEITRRYRHDIKIKDIPEIIENGERFVPFNGTLIDPALAERRRNLGTWAPHMCEPGYWVTYRPAGCTSVMKLGTIWDHS